MTESHATGRHGHAQTHSDGTAAGTRKIYPGDTTTPNEFVVESIVVDGSCAWLAASDGISGMEPWRTTGEKGSVAQIAQLSDRGRLSRFPHPEVAGDQAWFFADTPEERLFLWRSDGTANGTQMVGDGLPLPVGRYTRFLGTLGEAVFFTSSLRLTLWVPTIRAGGPALSQNARRVHRR